MLTNEAGEVTSHLQGMFNRTIRLLEAGIKPVYVFDGKPPELKRQEIAKRYSKRADATADLAGAIEVTKQHNDDCKRLLRLIGVPVVEATSEAEAQCAALCKSGKVYGVASEDMDSITFGAPKFLRHLMDPSSRKIPVMEFDVAKTFSLPWTSSSICAYCPDVTTVTASETALKLIRQHGSIETILENINKDRYQIPEEWPYNEARKLFKEPDVLTDEEQLDIKWISPDEDV
ncbi:hypothetical protein F2Q69_00025003 [Brassica cretica]|uniref:Flap endonuclease 1 n=1 Tax=Brassica cretica TaxID=69181 RepID=A0A8S9Q2R3_BRACR|nr:hypothetical protein F2Q69_00025003 [Brassica cretica]